MTIDHFMTAQQATTPAKTSAKQGCTSGAGAATFSPQDMGLFFGQFLQNALHSLDAQGSGKSGSAGSDPHNKGTHFLRTGLDGSQGQDLWTKIANANTMSDKVALGDNNADLLDALSGGTYSADELAALLNALEPGSADGTDMASLDGNALDNTNSAATDIALPTNIGKNAFLIADEKSMRPALNDLQRLLQKIEKLAEAGDESLIAANITPQEIAALDAIVQAALNGDVSAEALEDHAENFAGLMAGLISITAPPPQQNSAATSKPLFLTDEGSDTPMIGLKDLRARLNALDLANINSAAAQNAAASDDAALSDVDEGHDADFDSLFKQFLKDGGVDKTSLADSMAARKSGATAQNNAVLGQNAHASTSGAQNGVLKGWPFGMSGSLFSPLEFSASAMHDMGMGVMGANTASLSTLSPLTALVTQSHAATQPHPGTQMVAASIQKNAASGESKNITLRLDPPELGRVEIKMSFGKDSAVKAILIAEKPETFMMLQRDSHILERALQDAGLEADGNSLSFELSQDGESFSQDGRHDGSRHQSGNGQTDENAETIIETTMTWHVDPQSGHMRYNILA